MAALLRMLSPGDLYRSIDNQPSKQRASNKRLALPWGDKSPDSIKQIEQFEWLGDIALRVDLMCPALGILSSGHHQDWNVDTARLERAREAPAVEYRHAHVQQH